MKFTYLIPFYIEIILIDTSNNGNMGLHGLHLSLYKRRNLLYLSGFSLLISYICNLLPLGLGFFIFALYHYFNYKLWKFVKA